MSKFKMYLEMAKSSEFSSGFAKSPHARGKVAEFLAGEESYDFEVGGKKKSFIADGAIKGTELKKGDLVAARYNAYNQGMQLYEILGVTDNDEKYGEGGVKFNSVKDCMKKNGVSSLKALEEKQSEGGKEYGHHFYLVVKDLEDGDEGPWFYLFKGRWARGSGAEALSFVKVKEVGKSEEKETTEKETKEEEK